MLIFLNTMNTIIRMISIFTNIYEELFRKLSYANMH